MRKDQVGTAAVDINLVAQVGERYGRALDVPARASFSPGTGPARFVGRTFLPEQEIERVLLARVVRVSAALGGELDHLIAAQAAQTSVVGDAAHPEVHVATSPVSVALCLDRAHQRDDLRDRLTHLRQYIGRS